MPPPQRPRAQGEVLFVGPDRGGKTLLIKRLGSHAHGKRVDEFIATNPTVGMQFDDISLQGVTVRVRELGGQMGTNWPNILASSHAVVYVVDISVGTSLSHAAVEIVEMLNRHEISRKPFLIALNKGDVRSKLSQHTINSILRLENLCRSNSNIHVIETSALHAQFDNLVSWICESVPAIAEAVREKKLAEEGKGKKKKKSKEVTKV